MPVDVNMLEKQITSKSFFKISNSPLFSKFVHDCCEEFIEGKPLDIKNYNDDVEWTQEDVNQVKAVIKNLFRETITNDKFHIEDFVVGEVLHSLQECIEIHRKNMEHYLIKIGFLDAEHNLVENIDWKLKWILGNSVMPVHKEPILQLKLGCCEKKEHDLKPKHNIIDLEMNMEQVDYLIHILEGILEELACDATVLS